EIGNIDVPMLVWSQRLNKAGAFLRRLLVPSVQESSGGEHAIHARRTGGDEIPVDHHVGQSTIALEGELLVKGDDRTLLVVEQPVIARDERVVLVDLAIASLPREELAASHADPRDEAIGRDLGLRGPRAHEVDDRIARVGGNPATCQGGPRSFFNCTYS